MLVAERVNRHTAEWRASDDPVAVKRRTLAEHFHARHDHDGPGPGATLADDGHAGSVKVHAKSVRNLPTARLVRAQLFGHARLHCGDLSWAEVSRRKLIEQGMILKMVSAELARRGVHTVCGLCA